MMINCLPNKKILLVGDWKYSIYEAALSLGFKENKCGVIPFRFIDYIPKNYLQKLQLKIKSGQFIDLINQDLLEIVKNTSLDIIFLNRSDIIYPNTLNSIKNDYPNIIIANYHNDNPYLGLRNRIKWRHFFSGIRISDITFVYRPNNILDAKRFGAKDTHILLPYYVKDLHYPISGEGYDNEVVFVGHYEDDGRAEYINCLVKNWIKVRVFGNAKGWNQAASKYPWIKKMDIHELWGDDYRRCIARSKISLVFLSKKNQDVWTRRCFEIPACGSMMLAPRTGELLRLFEDRVDAVYYDSISDFLDLVRYYLDHNEERERIALNGHHRCLENSHSEVDRAREILLKINSLKI